MLRTIIRAGFILTLSITLFIPIAVQAEEITVNLRDDLYSVDSRSEGQYLDMENFGIRNIPGKPRLPSRIVAVAIPPGASVTDVRVTTESQIELTDDYNIPPVTLRRVIGDENPELLLKQQAEYQQNYNAVYTRNGFYPESIIEFVRQAGFRKYNIADVRVIPFQYNPMTGSMILNRGIKIHITYTMPDLDVVHIQDNSLRMEAEAAGFIENYSDTVRWYDHRPIQRGLHDFVIVTTETLSSEITSLVEWETLAKGREVNVVTVEWISANYSGVDLAQKIRNFLMDKYPTSQWGIEDVLFVGRHTEVPMRKISYEIGYGSPRTDFYYAELSAPDSESWDSNGNGQIGETADAIEYYSEINVGRIPWSDPDIVRAVCEKSIAYEQNTDPAFKKNILLMGGYFWADTDNAVLMEEKVDQVWMADWTMTRMYEQNSQYYSTYPCDYELVHSNVLDVWPDGQFAFANWAGHGSPTGAYILGNGSQLFIGASDCPVLGNDYPSIIFADSCSNSDTDTNNLGRAMLAQGSVGFVGATKVALGSGGWAGPEDGSSQSLDYHFTTGVTSGEYSQGAAHQRALRNVYLDDGWYYDLYEMCEWTLWGNPNLGMGDVLSSNGIIALDQDYYAPGTEAVVTVTDRDLVTDPNLQESVDVTITTDTGDTEVLTLLEPGTDSWALLGTLSLAENSAIPGNGILEVGHGTVLTVTYIDEDNGFGGTDIAKTATATVDAIPPEILNVSIDKCTDRSFTVSWVTDEATRGLVCYGQSVPDQNAYSAAETTTHTVRISDLDSCMTYLFYIEVQDGAGNIAVANNSGENYAADTMQLVEMVSVDLSVNPEWLISGGAWAYGQPTGNAGDHGGPDPTSGKTGNNVYGYNLQGGYENDEPAYSLTTTPFDCSGKEGVVFSFWRWLGVETQPYDYAAVQVSNNGADWVNIWENPSVTLDDGEWVYQEFDVSEYADDSAAVQFRWVMGTTDQGWTYCGWNIDDIKISYAFSCNEPTPTPVPEMQYGMNLLLDDIDLETGDQFNLHFCLLNSTDTGLNLDVFILLDVYGQYWFWPSWTAIENGIDFQAEMEVNAYGEYRESALSFQWPELQGAADGLKFYGAAFHAGSFEFCGELNIVTWQYH